MSKTAGEILAAKADQDKAPVKAQRTFSRAGFITPIQMGNTSHSYVSSVADRTTVRGISLDGPFAAVRYMFAGTERSVLVPIGNVSYLDPIE